MLIDPRSTFRRDRRTLITGAVAAAAYAALPKDSRADLLLTGAGIAASSTVNPTTIFGSQLLFWFSAADTAKITKDGSNNVSAWAPSGGSITEPLAQSTGANQMLWSATGSPNSLPAITGSSDWMAMANNITINPTTLTIGMVFKATGFVGYHGILGINEQGGSGYGIQRAGGTALGWQSQDFIAFGGSGYTGGLPRVIMDPSTSGVYNGSYHTLIMQIGTTNAVSVNNSNQTLRTGAGESGTGDCPSVTDKFSIATADPSGAEATPTSGFVDIVFADNATAPQLAALYTWLSAR